MTSAKFYIYIGVGSRDLFIDEAHTALGIFQVFFPCMLPTPLCGIFKFTGSPVSLLRHGAYLRHGFSYFFKFWPQEKVLSPEKAESRQFEVFRTEGLTDLSRDKNYFALSFMTV